ncbi:hypothetical protein D9758_009108 [Tetrapyrgos nigripes]|uniref:Uncharacterized protein n=1 Tax=Tetrapyrgos nigripes TaxID=182062 RepID=A0A8H5LKA2_9AGAR|nr:hypothetical protein D9758_009108 [Tetrapyrgos nigripes]
MRCSSCPGRSQLHISLNYLSRENGHPCMVLRMSKVMRSCEQASRQGSFHLWEAVKKQWRYYVQHLLDLENSSAKHCQMAFGYIFNDLLNYTTDERGLKTMTKVLKGRW